MNSPVRALTPIDCPFRYGVQVRAGAETATCGLLKQVVGNSDDSLFEVRREACEQCAASFSLSSVLQNNPVLPSLLYSICDGVLAQAPSAAEAGKMEPLQQLQQQALDYLQQPASAPPAACCDVVICCQDDSPQTHRAIQSVFDQQQAFPILHVVDDGGGGAAAVARYADKPNVVTHRNPTPQGVFATIHELTPHLRTPYVAVQAPRSESFSDRLAFSLSLLEREGAEVLGGALETGGGVVSARRPADRFSRGIPPQTLVFRRASLVDMGGFATADQDEDAEFVYRAFREGRGVVLTERATVFQSQPPDLDVRSPAPDYPDRRRSLRQHARGWPLSGQVACDVVLPFHGHLEFAREALESALHQNNAQTIVHLIDDKSPENTDEFLRFWATHPRVRTYRNAKNIGPFASFNNILPFAETELIAVQDGDDISLPHRFHFAANHLRLSDADIFGAAMETFGDDQIVAADNQVAARNYDQRPPYKSSRFPDSRGRYFLENPTAVMRTAVFRQLGGYGDYGHLQRSRTGVDTEFFIRAHFAGARFAISRDIAVKYRCHADSATQNPLSGWGSRARAEAVRERRRRVAIFVQRRFDPRVFGALELFRGATQRWPGS